MRVLVAGRKMPDLIQIQKKTNSSYTEIHRMIVMGKVEGSVWVCSFTELKGTASRFALAPEPRKRS